MLQAQSIAAARAAARAHGPAHLHLNVVPA
jgi:hypothetical protein